MGGVGATLAEHAFDHLFIECLGWDRLRAFAVPSDQLLIFLRQDRDAGREDAA